MDIKHKISFSSSLTKISGQEFDKYLSLANLEKLRPLMPSNINLEDNPDVLGAVLNIFVGNRTNANGDAITNKTAVKCAENFVWKYVNALHKRQNIIGVICNIGYSKFGSNELLTREDAEKSEDPVNISAAILLYKTILSDEFIELLEDSSDENSDNYGMVSASWEVYFGDYDIAIGGKNLNEAEIISDSSEKEKLEKHLKANKGLGKLDNKHVYRVFKDDFMVPAGIALTDNPAADVRGIEIFAPTSEKAYEITTQPQDVVAEEQKTSLSENLDVNINENLITPMKLTEIKDLTDENLRQASAKDVVELIEAKIQELNASWVTKQNEAAENFKAAEIAKAEYQAQLDAEKNKVAELEAKILQISTKFDALNIKIAEKEAQETFDARMSYFDTTYNLDDEDKGIVSADIVNLASDTFEAYKTKMAKLLSNKLKTATKLSTASVETPVVEVPKVETVVEVALANATKTGETIPNNAASNETESFVNRYKAAFSIENCTVANKK